MKSKLVLIPLVFVTHFSSWGQCSVVVGDGPDPALMSYLTCYEWTGGIDLGQWDTPKTGWTYSWAPTTGLTNPTTLNAVADPQSTTSYTLTVTAPGCGTFMAGQVQVIVEPNTPAIGPAGPITQYYWYEGNAQIVLTSNAVWSNWYKNGQPVQYAINALEDPQIYVVTLTGNNSGTDYYEVHDEYSCNPWSNRIYITYTGVTNRNQYPVTIPAQSPCASSYPLTLTQPVPGTNPVYYWQKGGANPGNFTLTQGSGNAATLSQSGCGMGCQVSIYTRAVAQNGTEIRMDWGTGINLGCKTMSAENLNPSKNILAPAIRSMSRSQARVGRSLRLRSIQFPGCK